MLRVLLWALAAPHWPTLSCRHVVVPPCSRDEEKLLPRCRCFSAAANRAGLVFLLILVGPWQLWSP